MRPRHTSDPAVALALRVIELAVREWKHNSGAIEVPMAIDELRTFQIDRAKARAKSLVFFHSEWFVFLLQSSSGIDKVSMFEALGIPVQEMPG